MSPVTMGFRHLFGSIAIASVLLAKALHAETPPNEAAIEELVESMRAAALAYDSRLPDFICTQVTRREMGRQGNQVLGVRAGGSRSVPTFSAPSADSGWKPIDTIEEQLTYFGHKESYKLVAMNGKRVAPGEQHPPGAGSSGEFGSTLGGIFDPASHAEFRWKRTETLRGQRVYVFSFSIAKENSTAQLVAGNSRLVVAYHGLIFVERETNTIIRVTTEAEIPRDFPLQGVTHVLDYGRTVIAGERFLVPLHSEMQMRASQAFIEAGRPDGSSLELPFRNSTDFRSYKKYGAEATLKPE